MLKEEHIMKCFASFFVTKSKLIATLFILANNFFKNFSYFWKKQSAYSIINKKMHFDCGFHQAF